MYTIILDKHTNEQYGAVVHSNSLTDYELLDLAGIHNETDGIEWGPEEYTFVQLSDKDAASIAAATLGRAGGSVTSDAKAAAARENGKRGGRPRKRPHA